jgi:hypothetical protein
MSKKTKLTVKVTPSIMPRNVAWLEVVWDERARDHGDTFMPRDAVFAYQVIATRAGTWSTRWRTGCAAMAVRPGADASGTGSFLCRPPGTRTETPSAETVRPSIWPGNNVKPRFALARE